MAGPAKKTATYDDLYNLPDNVIGQIIDGELIATRWQSRQHALTSTVLSAKLGAPYDLGEGGPGGWIILHSLEVKLGDNILVPDLAGWLYKRFPIEEETNWVSVCPDWVCEIISPETVRIDKTKKMPVYARHGVGYFRLIDPTNKTLDVYKLESGKWMVLETYAENDKFRAEPFEEVEIDLGSLWF